MFGETVSRDGLGLVQQKVWHHIYLQRLNRTRLLRGQNNDPLSELRRPNNHIF